MELPPNRKDKSQDLQTNQEQNDTPTIVNNDHYNDLERIETELKKLSIWKRNPKLCQQVLHEILPNWKKDLRSTTTLNNPWTKIRKRIAKELNESEPCIEFVQSMLERQSDDKIIIVDLCSGFGITSMLLSELLPKSRIEKICLIDKSFPLLEKENVLHQPHQISVGHLLNREWPIPLRIRKMNLKRGREIQQLLTYVLPPDKQVIFLGIHLCKALSVHAIKLYQSCGDRALGFVLKPCCLPGSRNLYAPVSGKNVPIVYQFSNGYSFQPLDLYDTTTTNDDGKKSTIEGGDDVAGDEDVTIVAEEEGAHLSTETSTKEIGNRSSHNGRGHTTNKRFSQWVQHLAKGCTTENCTVRVDTICIQKQHFQNEFIFCETILSQQLQ